MRTIIIGDFSITSIIERDGPWRTPEAMFPAYDPVAGADHLRSLPREVFDPISGRMVITYQTFVVRTLKHTVLVDTCTGDHKGYPAPMEFDKRPWLNNFEKAGLSFEQITHVFCTHLHIDHCGWNTVLRDGRWVPTFPNAKYIFYKAEYAAWETLTKTGKNSPGNVWAYNCLPVVEAGQALLVDDTYSLDDTFTLIPTRMPELFTIFDTDTKAGIASRRKFLESVAGIQTILLPVHFPNPTAGRIAPFGQGFDYKFVR